MQALRNLARTPEVSADLAPDGYAHRRVRYLLRLADDGTFQGLDSLAESPTGSGARGRLLAVPNAVRSSGIKPLLLADGPDYLFGIAADGTTTERTRRCQDAFLTLLTECAQATGLGEVRAVKHYLETGAVPEGLDPTAELITFEVGGRRLIELPEIQAYWQRRQAEAGGQTEMECLVCGETAPVAEVWPVLVRGIPGGQTSGNQLVSANVSAFESYSLAGSRTSPACLDCAAAIGRALNWLLERDANHLRLPSSVFVYWMEGSASFDFGSLIREAEPEQVAELLQAAATGRQGAVDLEVTRFFIAELTASGARIAVRSWIEAPLKVVRKNVKDYFRRQAIVGFDGSESLPLSLRQLLGSTVREFRDLNPQLPHDLVEMALNGSPAPARLLSAAVRRSQVEQRVTRPRAALMKLALLGGGPYEEESMVQLDESESRPAYLCGRLLAELEAAQRAALGRVNATLTDRYYGAASTSPRTVFGPLLRNAQNHLGKLRRDRFGAYFAIDGRLTDILERLHGSLPAVLTLEDQALFGLGYYHQKAADRAAMRAAQQAGSQAASDLAVTVDDAPEESA